MKNKALVPNQPVGIHGYGSYIPRYRLPATEINRIWKDNQGGVPVQFKSVPGIDEDTITMSIEASRNAIARAAINLDDLRAVWVGSESHPYSVKPSSTVVAEAIGAGNLIQAGDWEFACKAGTEALVAGIGMVGSGMIDFTLAIGADTAQARPGDALEYTAAAGAAAFIIGKAEGSLATIDATMSYVSDTPDFWRRADATYPSHGVRFTGEPAYFKHIVSAGTLLLEDQGMKPEDFSYAVFHQPNAKFPQRAGALLGFSKEQIKDGLLSPWIGNTYSAAALMGLTSIFDKAKAGEKIFMVSYGSGAGSDAFIITVTDELEKRREYAPFTQVYIDRKTEIDYAEYARLRGKIILD